MLHVKPEQMLKAALLLKLRFVCRHSRKLLLGAACVFCYYFVLKSNNAAKAMQSNPNIQRKGLP
jgi:hypothetical protein